MLRILLVRHGETDWNRERRIMGMEAVPINANGQRQAWEMQKSLGVLPLDGVFTSPMLRARQTAEVLCAERDLSPQEDQRLQEIHYGDWVGKTFEEVRALPGYSPYYSRPSTPVSPGGESLLEVRDRAMGFLNELKKRGQAETLLVVSHADWIKILLMEILQIPFENIWKFRVDNVSVSLLECGAHGDRVICMNQRGDMERLFVTRFSF